MLGVLRVHIELAVVEQLDSAETRLDGRAHHIPGVTQSVHVTDLTAIESGNGQLGDAPLFQDKLNDDLGVEMEIVGVFLEGQLGQCLGGVEAITGMKLGQVGPEHLVLKAREDLVAHPLVKGHPTLAGRLFVDHARAKHGFDLARQERLEETG